MPTIQDEQNICCLGGTHPPLGHKLKDVRCCGQATGTGVLKHCPHLYLTEKPLMSVFPSFAMNSLLIMVVWCGVLSVRPYK